MYVLFNRGLYIREVVSRQRHDYNHCYYHRIMSIKNFQMIVLLVLLC